MGSLISLTGEEKGLCDAGLTQGEKQGFKHFFGRNLWQNSMVVCKWKAGVVFGGVAA